MEEIQTNLGKLEFIDDRIIYIKVKNNLSVTFKDGIEFRNNLLKLTDKKIGILVDAMNNKSTASINSIRFFSTDKAFNEICTYQCAITNKISIRIIANIYLKFLKNKEKAKVFNNYNDALKWLKKKVKTIG